MAVVLNPVVARRYNPNARGNGTVVTMRSGNPFERQTQLVNSQMPGMGGLGAGITSDASAAASAAAQQASSGGGWSWGSFGQSLVGAGLQIGTQIVNSTLVQPLPTTQAQPLPISPPQALPTGAQVPVYAPAPSPVPWAMIGIGAAVLVGVVVLMGKRKG